MKQLLLPLWRRVLFVDWHGVASSDPFWMSIMSSVTHPLHSRLSKELKEIFQNNDSLIRAWMRGELRAENIIEMLDITLDKRFNDDYLMRKLIEDCKLMKVNSNLIDLLRQMRNHAFVVMATDNMDCFLHYYSMRTCGRRRQIRPSNQEHAYKSFNEAVQTFDDILCSSEIGVLKRENPIRFFGMWLRDHSLRFSDALLLDDVTKNCEAFRSVGGTAFEIDNHSLNGGFALFRERVIAWVNNVG